MNRTVKFILAASIWIVCGVGATGIFNAEWRVDFHDLAENPREALKGRNQYMILGIVAGPMGLLVSLAVSGGAIDGWTLSAEAFPCDNTPEIWCGAPRPSR